MSVSNPILLIIGLLLAVLSAMLMRQAPTLPIASRVACVITVVLLALAGGDIAWRREVPADVVVLIDRSPSTRGAAYRDPASLDALLETLLPAATVRRIAFADGIAPIADGVLDDVVVDRTRLPAPPPADAYVLLSDGRWHAPPPEMRAPVFAVIDPELQSAEDRAIVGLEPRGDRLGIRLRASAPGRLVGTGFPTTPIPAGRPVIELPLEADWQRVDLRVEPADRWPENDAMSLRRPAETIVRRVWIGDRPRAGFEPGQVLEATDLLDASIVVLAGPGGRVDALDAYVRRAGGALLILAGDEAGAAASIAGTIDALSPLAATPPEPVHRQMIVVDASGSMAQPTAGGQTRWHRAIHAVQESMQALPRDARVDVGGFAASLRWWQRGATPGQWTVPHLVPSGPTNLQAALDQLPLDAAGVPATLLIISDGRAVLDDPVRLASQYRDRSIVPHLLAIEGRPEPAVRSFAESAGGAIVSLDRDTDWTTAAIATLRRQLVANLWRDDTILMRWLPDAGPAARAVARHRAGWARDGSTLLAATDDGRSLAATRTVGVGEVAAVLVDPTDDELSWLVERLERRADDPRLQLRMDDDRLRITALGNGRPMNALPLRVQLDETSLEVRQSAPGEYVVTWTREGRPRVLTVLLDGRPIARRAVAGVYPIEFAEIGIDHAALQSLTDATGGAIVHATTPPLPIPRPVRPIRLQQALLIAAALLLGGSLVWWRSGR